MTGQNQHNWPNSVRERFLRSWART